MKRIYNGIEYDCDDKYSHKDFTGRSLKGESFNSKVIYGSCFSQEIVDRHIFPDDMTDATFIKCNLDNCYIPVGNTVIDCWQRRFKCCNDLNDWLIDNNDIPIKPFNHKIFTKLSLPMPDPKDIPAEKCIECVDLLSVSKEKALAKPTEPTKITMTSRVKTGFNTIVASTKKIFKFSNNDIGTA